jgi:predicted small lipoprotein YifL
MPNKFLIVFALSCYSLLMSCGTKGPLYIPEQRYPQKEPAQESPKNSPTPPLPDKAY